MPIATVINAMRGSIGLKIKVNISASTVGATLCKIRYEKPSGEIGEWVAQIESGTSISYTTVSANDLDEEGDWNIQAYVENGWKLSGTQCILHVEENIGYNPDEVILEEGVTVSIT